MKLKTILICLGLFSCSISFSQVDTDNLKAILTEGFTVKELENIWQQVTYKNHGRWLKSKGYKLVSEYKNVKMFHYQKNDMVNLGIYYDDNKEQISEILFHSSPQKYYQALRDIEENAAFRKISETGVESKGEKGTMTKWAKGNYIFYARTDQYKIGMYVDKANEASRTYTKPTVSATKPVVTSKATTTNPAETNKPNTTRTRKYDFSDVNDLANMLNAKLNSAELKQEKGTDFKFQVFGKPDFIKSSINFFVKDNQLYIKMHFPKNGECDYGLKVEKAVYNGNKSTGRTVGENWYRGFHFKYTYECNQQVYNDLVVFIQDDFKQDDLTRDLHYYLGK